MQNYQYEMNLQASSEREAEAKMKALTILAKHLNENELTKLADVIKNNPNLTATAKAFLGF